jgi:hypothetical protein
MEEYHLNGIYPKKKFHDKDTRLRQVAHMQRGPSRQQKKTIACVL